jgi:hypothetical protein
MEPDPVPARWQRRPQTGRGTGGQNGPQADTDALRHPRQRVTVLRPSADDTTATELPPRQASADDTTATDLPLRQAGWQAVTATESCRQRSRSQSTHATEANCRSVHCFWVFPPLAEAGLILFQFLISTLPLSDRYCDQKLACWPTPGHVGLLRPSSCQFIRAVSVVARFRRFSCHQQDCDNSHQDRRCLRVPAEWCDLTPMSSAPAIRCSRRTFAP